MALELSLKIDHDKLFDQPCVLFWERVCPAGSFVEVKAMRGYV
jgi:hypothetical protein